jgi:mannose-1-phosphate guanylyltransferase
LVCDLRTQASGQVIALVGVDDLAVVVTDDALLVIPRSRSQDVKKALEEVKRRAR